MTSWKVGSVTIHRVEEMVVPIDPTLLIPEATAGNLQPMHGWLKPYFLNDDHSVPLSIHAFLVESGDTRIVVDTCIGNDKPRSVPHWNRRQGDFLTRLEALSAPRESIDVVLCTHLHVDHVGWNTMLVDGRWVPTFPKARYLIGREEWAFWQNETDLFGPEAKADSIVPIIESDQLHLVETDHQVAEVSASSRRRATHRGMSAS